MIHLKRQPKPFFRIAIFIFITIHIIILPANAKFSSLFLNESWIESFRILNYYTYQKPANSLQNPNNDFILFPHYLFDLELRPNINTDIWRFLFSVKPRMNLNWSKIKEGSQKGDTDFEDNWFINEYLIRLKMMENLFVSYGRENLQWGPSFLSSPSNPFFSENYRDNPIIEGPGMDFARLVWLPKSFWTLSLIANIDKGRLEYNTYDFKKAYAIKLDYNGDKGFAGLITSTRENDRKRLGAFGGWIASDALLLYGEGYIRKGSSVLYPIKDPNSPYEISMMAVNDTSSSLDYTILLGGTYTFKSFDMLTIEYLYNRAGYNDRQAEDYLQLKKNLQDSFSLSSQLAALTLSQTANPRLRHLRRNYIMMQYILKDPHDVLDLTFRWTQNIDDRSGQLVSILDFYTLDHLHLFFMGFFNFGERDSEFMNYIESILMIGMEYTF